MIVSEIVGGGDEPETVDTAPDAIVDFAEAKEAVQPQRKAKAAKAKDTKVASEPKAKKPKAEQPAKQPRENKTDTLVLLLLEERGASVAEVAAKFGWLPHTTRAAISTLPKKKQFPEGHALASEKIEGRGRVYRIVKV
ncbi:DUF3489 domain-containing protein [Sinorhizobium fredii]|uniref:DUF3489 domain-containing protein n=1 Tax=Rhizobium fredii TaxID=380 RepID=UPI0004B7275D|nr:DUF3489 domain-containing protein [Sinorhizobium fredii]